MTARYRKKPVEIEAVQFTGDNHSEIAEFIGAECNPHAQGIEIATLEGEMMASPGDWIIKGVLGEFYPCKPDIFEQTYTPVFEGNSEPLSFATGAGLEEEHPLAVVLADAVNTDGAHHKQWYLEQVAERLGIDLPDHDPGIAP